MSNKSTVSDQISQDIELIRNRVSYGTTVYDQTSGNIKKRLLRPRDMGGINITILRQTVWNYSTLYA